MPAPVGPQTMSRPCGCDGQLVDLLAHLRPHAELLEVGHLAGAVEDAHDHLLADHAAGRGHAEVDLPRFRHVRLVRVVAPRRRRPSSFFLRRLCTSAEKLPSCGLRFSVMSRSASTLKMLTTESPIARLNGSAAWRMPSMRKRTVISSLVGSRWMSVVRMFDGVVDHLRGPPDSRATPAPPHAVGVFLAAAGALADEADGNFLFRLRRRPRLEIQAQPAAAQVAQVARRQHPPFRLDALVADADVDQAGAEVQQQQHRERQQEQPRREQPDHEQGRAKPQPSRTAFQSGTGSFSRRASRSTHQQVRTQAEVDGDDRQEGGDVEVEAAAAREVARGEESGEWQSGE